MRAFHWTQAAALVMLAACGKREEAVRAPAADTGGQMGGMQMSMQGMQMMPMMRAHVDSLAAMGPEQMAAMMAAHQDLASRMMDAMGADMRQMNMQPDAAWTALSDSLRQDLAELPALSGDALENRMQVHVGRMRRMMDLHQQMMKM